VSFFTSRPALCEDVSSLFNLLTGYSAPPRWNELVIAPVAMHERIVELIDREREHALAGRASGIVAKMNALVDADVIEALYRASQAGVPIRLLVRGICCLRPGVPGVSETIEVRALLDRFLEHARVMRFANGGAEEFYFASADWMPRNFHRRVEILCPVEDPQLRGRIREILDIQLADNSKAWILRADGAYDRVKEPGPALRSQQKFIEQARAASRSGELGAISSRKFHLGQLRPSPASRSSLHPPPKKARKKHGP
jgi:polyphosphate kinase